MKLLDICLFNFRRYEHARFQFHPEFTILIGDNGQGKTTILDAVAIMLGTYFQGSGIKTGQSVIRKTDARFLRREKGKQIFLERLKNVYLTAHLRHNTDEQMEWRREIGDRGAKARQFVDFGKNHREAIERGESLDLPLFLYYGSGRLWNIARDRKTTQPGSQLDAYHFCLDPKSDQKAFEKWYKKLTFAALQQGEESPALQVIQQVILACVPNVQKVYHDVTEDQIVLFLENTLIPFDSLSDGYRNMVAMAADIAYRAVLLNPHLEASAAKQTQGIVLIDEIDLHLHPKWQRQVVSSLRRAFPRLQFIATTHSPFIVQSLEPGEVIDLNQQPLGTDAGEYSPQNVAIPGPEGEYSHRSIEDIVEQVMGVDVPQRSQRYQDMYDTAQEYYRVLQNAESTEDDQKEVLKQRLDELSAPFSDNVAYHAFLEMERLASGLGSSQPREIES